MNFKFLLAFAVYLSLVQSENVGWKSYFVENPTEFHDILLTWEKGNETKIPSWLSGVYIRNGPAQVLQIKIAAGKVKLLQSIMCKVEVRGKENL